jgi:hypothetical protein
MSLLISPDKTPAGHYTYMWEWKNHTLLHWRTKWTFTATQYVERHTWEAFKRTTKFQQSYEKKIWCLLWMFSLWTHLMTWRMFAYMCTYNLLHAKAAARKKPTRNSFERSHFLLNLHTPWNITRLSITRRCHLIRRGEALRASERASLLQNKIHTRLAAKNVAIRQYIIA